jgi:serine/threonine protein kinase
VSKFRPGDALPGRDGWKLTELLGTGGFGEVWLAAHPHFVSLKRAVKFCLELTDKDRRLLHEGGLIDRVMRAGPVPNVVPLVDANLAGEAPWLMYEYVAGGDLVSLVASSRDLEPAKRHTLAVAGLKQIAGAVAHFHRLGVVHRDLKPANVLVERHKVESRKVEDCAALDFTTF